MKKVMLLVISILSVAAAAQQSESYQIGASDVLQVHVWKEPELSGTVTVRPDGRISLPLVDDIEAAGETPVNLAKKITDRLGKFVSNAKVTVTVQQPNSHRVFVVGSVLRPGSYPLLPKMTVLQAISSAGGINEMVSSGKKTYVLRNENGKQVKYPFDYKSALKGNLKDVVELKAGDTILVP